MEKFDLTVGTEVLIDKIVGGGQGIIIEKVGENGSGSIYKVESNNEIRKLSEFYLTSKAMVDRIKQEQQENENSKLDNLGLTVGTEVLIDKKIGGGQGIIVEKVGDNGSGSIYKVESNNEIRRVSEFYLTPVKGIKKKQEEIDTEIDNIIKKLNLMTPKTLEEKLEVCCKVHWYIVNSNHYNNDMLTLKKESVEEEKLINELYAAIVEKESVCSGNSLEFKEILSRLGVKVDTIVLKSNSSQEIHMSNLVELDNKYYFFDSTLDYYYNDNFQKMGIEKEMCCAAVGSDFYTKIYKPLYVIDANTLSLSDLPENIAVDSIPIKITNKFITLSAGDNVNTK